jgi:hypothetical protein
VVTKLIDKNYALQEVQKSIVSFSFELEYGEFDWKIKD